MSHSMSSRRWAVAVAAIGLLAAGSGASALAEGHRAVPPQHRDVLPLTQYVNPFIGTAVSATSGYAGNNNPGAKVPFGFTNFGPDMPRTNFNGSGGYLNPPTAATGRINFFSLTHLNGVGCPGQGAVGMMPASAPAPVASSTGVPAGVSFRTSTESASPGHYGVTLDNKVKVDLTATTRTGMAQLTYPDAGSGYFSIDTRLNGNSNRRTEAGKVTSEHVSLSVSDAGRVLSGQSVAPAFCTPYGTPYNSPVYFYAEFDKPLVKTTESGVNTVRDGAALLHYDLPTTDPVLRMRVGISAVSVANAKLNLHTENATGSFEQTRKAADAAWNARLNTVQVDQAATTPATLTPAQRDKLVKFYTALYRVFASPTVYSDVNGDFRSMKAQRPLATAVDTTGGVEQRPVANVADYSYTRPDGSKGSYGTHYSSFSLWDTYRSQAQLLALLAPKEASEMMQSLVVDAQQCGAFPHWVDASDDSTPMAGDNALPVLAGTYSFGAKDFDVTTAARLVKQSVFDPASACNANKSMSSAEQYLRDGYYPSPEWSSSNIERWNSDRAAAAFLSEVPASVRTDPQVDVTQADLAKLVDRAGWWRKIFDADNGRIATRAAPTTPGTPGPLQPGTFHESTEPNYFWSFGYAWADLINAIGGKEQAVARLNRLFSIDSTLSTTPTLQQLNGGQDAQTYYMGNEMSFNAPWAYNWAGAPASSQYIVQKLMDVTFGTGRDGLPGNDDMGALSSWYVFAALGMYPTVGSSSGLALSTPQFQAATVWLKNKPVRITTDRDAATDPFIAAMTVDGTAQQGSWLPLRSIKNGADLAVTLSTRPTSWASADALTPPSGASADYTRPTASGSVSR